MTDTPNTTQGKSAVDWSRPIEAVHEDGRVVAVYLGGNDENPDDAGYHYTLPSLNDGVCGIWRPDGSSWENADPDWRIRNVADQFRGASNMIPEHPTPTQYAPELVERAFALIRTMALACPIGVKAMGDGQREAYETARSIVSDLPQEVEPIRRAEIRILGRNGVHDVSLAELGRLISGGARITSLKGVEVERGDAA